MITDIAVFRPGVGVFPVAVGDVIQLQTGDTLTVTASFSYTAPNTVNVTFVGYFGTFASRASSASVRKTLVAASISKSDSVTINIKATKAGNFGLGVAAEGSDIFDEVPDCIQVAASPGIIDSVMNMVMMMMMMGMIMPMMTSMGEDV